MKFCPETYVEGKDERDAWAEDDEEGFVLVECVASVCIFAWLDSELGADGDGDCDGDGDGEGRMDLVRAGIPTTLDSVEYVGNTLESELGIELVRHVGTPMVMISAISSRFQSLPAATTSMLGNVRKSCANATDCNQLSTSGHRRFISMTEQQQTMKGLPPV